MTFQRFLVESPRCGGITEIVGPGTTGRGADPMVYGSASTLHCHGGKRFWYRGVLCVTGRCCFSSPGGLPLSVCAFRTLAARTEEEAAAVTVVGVPPGAAVTVAGVPTAAVTVVVLTAEASAGTVGSINLGDGVDPVDTTAAVGIGAAGAHWATGSISLPCPGIAIFTTGTGCPTTTRTTPTMNGMGPWARTRL
jgi:hypothetical protein